MVLRRNVKNAIYVDPLQDFALLMLSREKISFILKCFNSHRLVGQKIQLQKLKFKKDLISLAVKRNLGLKMS